MSVGVFWDASGALHKCIVALLLLWFSVAVALPLLRRACAFPVLAHTGLMVQPALVAPKWTFFMNM